jgi:SNF2 family DNA or RNA helicase
MRPCRDARDVSDDKRSKRNAIEALAAKRRQQQDQTSPYTSTHDEDDNYSNHAHVNRTFKPHRRTTVIPDSSSSSDEEQERTPSGPDDDDSNDSFIVDDDYISDEEDKQLCNDVDTVNNSSEEEEEEEEEPSSSTTTTTQQHSQFNLPPSVNNHIYAHQQQAIEWMLGMYNQEAGGILADDMGLGKTMSSAAFISGLFHSNMARRVLIIAPKTLLAHWKSELEVCGLADLTDEFSGSVNERQRVLRRVAGSKTGQGGGGGIVLCTYGMLLHNSHLLSGSGVSSISTKIKWDVLFLDEGHKIKNHKIQLRLKLDELTTTTKIVITGTPIQNNLMELWSLFDYIQPGLLGDMVGFKSLYERRIVGGNDRHATLDEREKAAAASVALKRHIAPYMLRREKKDVMGSGPDNNTQEERRDDADASNHHEQPQQGSRGQQTTPSSRPQVQSISKKNDLICWLKLNPMQLQLYEAFLFSDEVRAALNSTHSPLAAITVLKKICDHPALLSERAQDTIIAGAERQKRRKQMNLRGGPFSRKADSSSDEADAHEEESDNSSSSSDDDAFSLHKTKRMADIKPDNTPQHQNRQQQNTSTYTSHLFKQVHEAGIGGSCKTTFTLSLLRDLVSNNHKVLIFSQSRVMLDILEAGIRREGWTWLRIDGTVASATERAQRVASFQAGAADIMMLTTQVGGLGLTLTAASRVIIVDPSWNPSTDQQSVDRAYRIGQDKNVVVYRLISCGTVEDKIYKKQVYKSGLAKGLLEDGDRHTPAGTTTTTNNKMNSLPTAYFTNSELKDLFTLNKEEMHSSSTRLALNAVHAGNSEDDSSLHHHIQFLHTLDGFVGTSDHDLLFSHKPEEKLHVRSEDFIVASASTSRAAHNKKKTAKKSKHRNSGNVYPSIQDVYNTTVDKSIAASCGSQSNNDNNNADNAMWSGGGGYVSDMFAKALKLQDSQQHQDIVVTATTGLTPQVPRAFSSSSSLLVSKEKATTPEKNPKEQELSVQEQLEKTERLLSNKGLVDGLPDSGAKLEVKAALLRAQLSAQRQGQREEEEVVVDEGEEEVIVIMDDDDEAEEKQEEDEEGGLPLQSTPPSSSHQEEVSEQTSFLRRLSGVASSFFTFSLTDASVAPPAVEVKDPPPPSEDRDGVEKQRMVVEQLQKRLYACAKTLNDPIKLSGYPDSSIALREKTLELEKEWREGKERLKTLEEMM